MRRSPNFRLLSYLATMAFASSAALAQPQPSTGSAAVSMPTGGIKAPGTASTDSASQLAAKLTNPVTNLISVPLQFNTYRGLGADGQGTS
ncbi:MAG: hypothetical protein WAO93_00045 [Orrella sp.]|jgi:hypothetical protein|uniref:hypothetical protein n=1 Tax=Orrella sp. TaxID=1921583 RepID=UPI003BD5A210